MSLLIAFTLGSALVQPSPPPLPPPSEPISAAPVALSPRQPNPEADPVPNPQVPAAESATTPAPTTEPGNPASAAACPCDPLDRMCRQNNADQCTGNAYVLEPAEAPVAETPATFAPATSLRPTSEPPDTFGGHSPIPGPHFHGQGVTLAISAGVGGCAQFYCATNPLSFVGRGMLGYRWPHVALVATAMGGVGPRTDLPGVMRTLSVDAGVEVFPTGPGRVEPYVGAGLGYFRVAETSILSEVGQPESDLRVYTSRGAFRMSAGLPIRVSERLSLGPRLDYTWGFGGQLCAANSFGSECDPIRDIDDELAGSDDPIALRAFRRGFFPRPWAATLELRLLF